MKILCLLLTAASLISSIASLPIGQDDPEPSNPAKYAPDNDITSPNPSVVNVQIDRFAQLIATHWQFDHLDSIKSACYEYIATQMKEHIDLAVYQRGEDETLAQQPFRAPNDVMDVDILQAQIFGAIQAHVGGRLPVMWDELGDKLGRPAIELYVRHIVLNHCKQDDNDDHVDRACLVEYGDQILSEIDRYIVRHLANIFDIMNTRFLPRLLQHTAKDLHQVLRYFNNAFDTEEFELSLRVLPWNNAEQRTQLYDFAALAQNSPDHASDIVAYYANLARI
ncbi:hypothetical protein BX666DRAFT_1925982 [Dichotomocladium elegans]|nr:hypothetical protein BX666DRAFT_1925982 [Dichotomocladium elegans]